MGAGLATAEEEQAEHDKADDAKEDDEEKLETKDRKGEESRKHGLGLVDSPDRSTEGGSRPASTSADNDAAKSTSSNRSSSSKTGSAPLTPATLAALNALSLDESGSATPRAKNPALEAEAAVSRRVKVRDYAFHMSDLRFVGLGPHRSRSNWSEGEPEPSTPQERSSEGWGGFGGFGGLGASFGPPSASPAAEPPSTGLSFGLGSWTKRDDEDVADHSASDYWSEDDELGPDEIYYHGGEEEPDGLYRTAYPFYPEGINEIAVDVGEFLDVRGRGGGEGWVVGTRLRDGVEGLVPEGYLERCSEADADLDTEWEQVRQMRRQREETPDRAQSANSENDEKERW